MFLRPANGAGIGNLVFIMIIIITDFEVNFSKGEDIG